MYSPFGGSDFDAITFAFEAAVNAKFGRPHICLHICEIML